MLEGCGVFWPSICACIAVFSVSGGLGWEPPYWCLISIVNDPPLCPVWVSDVCNRQHSTWIQNNQPRLACLAVYHSCKIYLYLTWVSVGLISADIGNISAMWWTLHSDEWLVKAVVLRLTDVKCTRLNCKSVEQLKYLVAFWPGYIF